MGTSIAIKLSIVHFLETETLVPYHGGKAFRFLVVKTNIFLNLMAMKGTGYLHNKNLESSASASPIYSFLFAQCGAKASDSRKFTMFDPSVGEDASKHRKNSACCPK